jgi:FG-GAP-like repeat
MCLALRAAAALTTGWQLGGSRGVGGILQVHSRLKWIFRIAALTAVAAGCCFPTNGLASNEPFALITVDPGQAPWGNDFGDLDGDGFLDAVEGGGYSLGSNVYWYQYPGWTKYQIGSIGGGDDVQVVDVNRDGAVDVVVNGGPILWYENPRGSGGDPKGAWNSHTIDSGVTAHDLCVRDVDADGKVDVLVRGEFGPTYLYLQGNGSSWTRIPMPDAEVVHQGSALGDLNGDGRVDIVQNGYWLEQPPNPVSGTWVKHTIVSFPSCSVAVGDLNGDGRLDVSLAVSEAGVGSLAWFEAPSDPVNGTWIRHDIDNVEDVHRHFLIDADRDGDLDIVFAEMHQSGSRRVGIYWNQGAASSFDLQVLATTGSHNIAVGDFDRDGDIDILGANWSTAAPDGGDIRIWRNDAIVSGAASEGTTGPVRVVLLENRPNPFQSRTEIGFRVEGRPEPGPFSLKIYDVQGRLIRTLWNASWPTSATIPWDARTDSGERVGAGVYFYQLEFDALRLTRRLVLLK